ncbi:MAG: FAD-binding protein [Gammaproteobacteria bacterium]
MKALIIIEHDNQSLKPHNLAVIAAAHQLNAEVTGFIAGHQCTVVIEQTRMLAGIQQVIAADAPAYAHALPENLAPLIAQVSQGYDYIIGPATAFGKNLLPRIAALLDIAPVTDVVSIVSADTFIRPIYAGNALETVQSLDALKILTVRPSAFLPLPQTATTVVPLAMIDTVIDNSGSEWIGLEQTQSERPELSSARVVIAGGRGLQSADNFKLLERIATQLNAALGASRAAVDAGFAPNDWQVGQTGKIVAPDLYIAVGISGAIQHLAGMKESKVIVAINKDPEAPILQYADFFLVGDLFMILPELEEALARLQL